MTISYSEEILKSNFSVLISILKTLHSGMGTILTQVSNNAADIHVYNIISIIFRNFKIKQKLDLRS